MSPEIVLYRWSLRICHHGGSTEVQQWHSTEGPAGVLEQSKGVERFSRNLGGPVHLHQRKPVGQPRVASLNDRAVSSYHSGDMQRYEEADGRWYRQVKETRRDGMGAGSLSTIIVLMSAANLTRREPKEERTVSELWNRS